MPATVIVGLQWGDEGKGKATDFLAGQVSWVVRYQGGDNAGHTIVLGSEVFKLHLVPSGVLYPHIVPLIGPGVVVNPTTLIGELDALTARGVDTSRVRVSHACHVIMPYHVAEDRASEARLGRDGIGTTNRGIGPAYADRASRVGLRMEDLLDEAALRRKLGRLVPDKNAWLAQLGDKGRLSPSRPSSSRPSAGACASAADRRHDDARTGRAPGRRPRAPGGRPGDAARPRPRVVPIRDLVQPVAAAPARAEDRPAPGLGGHRHHEGVHDASRRRPVPDGAPRRGRGGDRHARSRVRDHDRPAAARGWFDAVPLRYAVDVNSVSSIILNKLDILSGIDEIRLCVAYDIDGRRVERWPASAEEVARAVPVYETFPGWPEEIHGARTPDDLPPNARAYVAALAELAGVPITLVSVGPERTQTVMLDDRPLAAGRG